MKKVLLIILNKFGSKYTIFKMSKMTVNLNKHTKLDKNH